MKIGFFGDGKWAHLSLTKILDSQSFQVVFIVARNENPDKVLREYAEKFRIPFFVHPNVNSAEFLETIGKFNPDLNVSMSFNQIMKPEIIRLAPEGFINCHAGALPFYRGRNILNWAIINGEKEFGVTVHFIDEKIDTGDIILQNFCTMEPEDNYGSLLEKASKLCSETLIEVLQKFQQGKVERIKQCSVHQVGLYCSQRQFGDEEIDWNWTSERIHNFIGGISLPGPGARTSMGEKLFAILRSEKIPGAPEYLDKPGRVIGKKADGIIVKTGDSTIILKEIAEVNSSGNVGEAKIPDFRVGTTLGIDFMATLKKLSKRLYFFEKCFEEFFLKEKRFTKDWKKILVAPTSSIRSALEAMDREGLRVALVADEKFSLLGTLTDGDVRRGLINEVSLDEPVKLIMNSNPISVRENQGRDEIFKLMKIKSILQIPIVDEKNTIIGLERLENFDFHLN